MKKHVLFFVLIIVSVFSLVSCKADDYNKALELIEAGENEEAYELLKSVGSYKNARKMLNNFYFVPTRIVNTSISGESMVFELTYDDDHFPLRYVLTHFDGRTSTGAYEYDDNGFLLSARFEEPNRVTERKCTYNSKGLLATRVDSLTYNNTSHAFVYTNTFVYDEEDRLVKQDNSGINKWEYKYDDDGNLIEKIYTIEKPKSSKTYKYTYDTDGRLIKQKIDNNLEKYKLIEYFYDSDGRRNKVVATCPSGVQNTFRSFYDDNGLLIKETFEDLSGRQKIVDTVEIEYECIYVPHKLPEKALKLFDANHWRMSSFWWDP